MATFVLIHGAGDVGWYWHLVEAGLRARGHDTISPDLPCDDDSAGLPEYADTVAGAIGDRANLIVVAQSLGGFTAPLVCDRVAVELLVLVAPMIPAPGEAPAGYWTHQALREGTAAFRRQGNRVTLTPPPVLYRQRVYTSLMVRPVQVSPGGVHDLGYHVVWCPKYRRAVLTGSVADRCRELIAEKCAGHEWRIVALEVMPDHVHLFVKARPKDSPSFVANQLKGFTSRRLREEFPHLRSRLPTLWSRSYFVASVGAVSATTVQRYIDTQYERPWRKDRAR